MTGAPSPGEIFDRAVEEGERRLEQSTLELVSTGFIAGFTIVFGIVALGIVEAVVEPQFGELSKVGGALAFGLGVVFLVIGRTELFNENFFDPAAAAVDRDGSWLLSSLLRLWVVTLVLNLIGGFVFAVPGALPPGTHEALVSFAEHSTSRSVEGWFASAIAGGALVSMMSFLLAAVEGSGSRIAVSYVAGFLLALGPFDHVVVTVLHVFFGHLFGAAVGFGTLGAMLVVVTTGNFVGGLGLVTFTHVTQAMGERESDD